MQEYHANPRGFITDVLGIRVLDKWQEELLELLRQGVPRIAIASCNGSGKSFITSAIEPWWLLCKADATVSVCSATHTQVTEHMRLVRAHINGSMVQDFYDLDNSQKITLPGAGDASYIRVVPNNKTRPEAIQGLHHGSILTIFDEGSGIYPEIYMAQEGNMTTDGSTWIVIGNPLASGTAFHELFKGDPRWVTMHIDAREVMYTSKEWVRGMIEKYGIDDDRVRARVLGQFPRGAVNSVCGEADFLEAEERYKRSANDLGRHPKGVDPVVIGLDVATAHGVDSTVICAVSGPILLDIQELTHTDNVDLADQAFAYFQKWSARAIAIDYTGGYGAGPGDILKRSLPPGSVRDVVFSSRSSDPARWINKRAELWLKFGHEWIKTAMIPKIDRLKKEALAPEWWVTPKGSVQVEAKDDVKSRICISTDFVDSIICALSVPILQGTVGAGRPQDARSVIARRATLMKGATFC